MQMGKPPKATPYKELDLNLPWQSFDISHELTKKGIQKIVAAHFRQRLRAVVNEHIGLWLLKNSEFQ
jgi:hypothetical protein